MKENSTSILNKYESLKDYQKAQFKDFLIKLIGINSVDAGAIAAKGMVCRKCNGERFIKNGTIKGVQRYQCKKCKSTQSHDANTPLYHLKLKDKWVDFMHLMLDNEMASTCKNISKKLAINVKTAHYWRHKMLSSLQQSNPLEINEEVELDEVYLRFNVKGVIGKEKFDCYQADSHNNIESKLRIEEKKMVEEKHQAVFVCAHNRAGDFDFVPIKIHKKGSVSAVDLKNAMADFELTGKTVITDKEPAMKLFLDEIKEVNHLTFKSSDVKDGVIQTKNVHNNNINNTMMLFKDWMRKFNGFSTKYIMNYLKWFRYVRLFEVYKIKEMVNFSLLDKESYPRFKNIFLNYEAFVNV